MVAVCWIPKAASPPDEEIAEISRELEHHLRRPSLPEEIAERRTEESAQFDARDREETPSR